jgi:hypothetical protein
MTRLFMTDAAPDARAQRAQTEQRLRELRARLSWCDSDEAEDVRQQVAAFEAVLASMNRTNGRDASP